MLPLAILSCNTKKKHQRSNEISEKINLSTYVFDKDELLHLCSSSPVAFTEIWSVIYFHGSRLFAVTDCVVVYIEYETSNKNVSLKQTFLDKNMRIASLQCLYIILGVCKYRT